MEMFFQFDEFRGFINHYFLNVLAIYTRSLHWQKKIPPKQIENLHFNGSGIRQATNDSNPISLALERFLRPDV
jgi:hypothetical protein